MIIETTGEPDLAQESGGETGDDAAIALLMSRSEQGEQQEEEEEKPESQEAAEEGEEEAVAEEVEDDDPEIDLGDLKAKKSEILAWKQGEMKDADYRRKTAEAAEVKRAAEAERQQVRQEREFHANRLEVLIHGLQTQLIGDQQELAKLAETDPAEWVRANAAFQQRYANLQAAVQERQQLANRTSAEQEQEVTEWRNGEAKALQEKLPEWSDEKVKAAESRQVAEYLINQGYSEKELSELFDHRALLVARDAAKWREHQAAQKTLKEKQTKSEPPKGLRPGVAQQKTDQKADEITKLRDRARRTGKQDDIAAYLIAKQG